MLYHSNAILYTLAKESKNTVSDTADLYKISYYQLPKDNTLTLTVKVRFIYIMLQVAYDTSAVVCITDRGSVEPRLQLKPALMGSHTAVRSLSLPF